MFFNYKAFGRRAQTLFTYVYTCRPDSRAADGQTAGGGPTDGGQLTDRWQTSDGQWTDGGQQTGLCARRFSFFLLKKTKRSEGCQTAAQKLKLCGSLVAWAVLRCFRLCVSIGVTLL